MVEVICHACGKRFSVKPYRANKARFCSSSCWARSDESKKIVSDTVRRRHLENPSIGSLNPNWKEKVECECLNCGKDFKVMPSRKRLFCCSKCSNEYLVGPCSPNWKGGVTPRTVTTKWKKLRQEVFERDVFKCKYCNSSKKLVAHHVRPVRYGGIDALDNLETVCASCHQKVEKHHFENILEEVIANKCCQCMNNYADGRKDCKVKRCPLYPWMPYNSENSRAKKMESDND
jgi:uncharacterized CHY-type Zn-finger protein